MSGPEYGDRVRVLCTATGRYLDYGLALVVSAMDGSLFIDEVATDREPHPTLPVPSDDALAGALEVLRELRCGRLRAERNDKTGQRVALVRFRE